MIIRCARCKGSKWAKNLLKQSAFNFQAFVTWFSISPWDILSLYLMSRFQQNECCRHWTKTKLSQGDDGQPAIVCHLCFFLTLDLFLGRIILSFRNLTFNLFHITPSDSVEYLNIQNCIAFVSNGLLHLIAVANVMRRNQ